MIIGFTGYVGVGKDVAAEYLIEHHGYQRRAFADKLKEFIEAVNPIVWDPVMGYAPLSTLGRINDVKRHNLFVRERLLQDYGEKAKEVFGDRDFWVNQATADLEWSANVVFSDVRFPQEREAIKAKGGMVVRLERDGIGPVNDHVSEQEITHDRLIHTKTGDFNGLYTALDMLVTTNFKKITVSDD